MRLFSNHESRIAINQVFRRLAGSVVVLGLGIAMVAAAAAEPYGIGNIRLGASFDELARSLDFRDVHGALEAQLAAKATQPDLGRRGYGCMRREDPYADIACVSHEEKIDGTPTREIRLQFLDGVLQQLSITAEISKFEAVLAKLRQQHGAPQETRAATARTFASYHWRNADSTIAAYSGKDLVFVSFELAGYGQALERRQRAAAPGRR
jgi:hypothetical protein